MPDIPTLAVWAGFVAPWVGLAIVLLKYLDERKLSGSYRAAQERIIAAKDAQIAQAQETAKAKDAEIAVLNRISAAEVLKQIDALKELFAREKEAFEQRIRQWEEDETETQAVAAEFEELIKQPSGAAGGVAMVVFRPKGLHIISQKIVQPVGQPDPDDSAVSTSTE